MRQSLFRRTRQRRFTVLYVALLSTAVFLSETELPPQTTQPQIDKSLKRRRNYSAASYSIDFVIGLIVACVIAITITGINRNRNFWRRQVRHLNAPIFTFNRVRQREFRLTAAITEPVR